MKKKVESGFSLKVLEKYKMFIAGLVIVAAVSVTIFVLQFKKTVQNEIFSSTKISATPVLNVPSSIPSVPTVTITDIPTPKATNKTTSSPRPTVTTAKSGFVGTVVQLSRPEQSRMVSSGTWKEGCPVPMDDLRLLKMNYYDYKGEVQFGDLVVHKDVADKVLKAFEKIFEAKFPIKEMELIDKYKGDDSRSMLANNTSAFNCRYVAGTQTWSEHAYGKAIDINPIQNPEIKNGRVDPPTGASYANRDLKAEGMIHMDDVVVKAFKSIGWKWGGEWIDSKDYMHFSLSGK